MCVLPLSCLSCKLSIPGADDRDRTGDLVLTKDVLCQLSYIGLRRFAASADKSAKLRRASEPFGRQVGRTSPGVRTAQPISRPHFARRQPPPTSRWPASRSGEHSEPETGLPAEAARAARVSRRLERETGIEPATNSLEGCDSTTELLPPSFHFGEAGRSALTNQAQRPPAFAERSLRSPRRRAAPASRCPPRPPSAQRACQGSPSSYRYPGPAWLVPPGHAPPEGTRQGDRPAAASRRGIVVAREGFEPSKPLGRQIYSLLRLTASLPRQNLLSSSLVLPVRGACGAWLPSVLPLTPSEAGPVTDPIVQDRPRSPSAWNVGVPSDERVVGRDPELGAGEGI